MSAAASGQALPTLDVPLAYVRACGAEAEDWEQRWDGLSADRNQEAMANRGGGLCGGQAAPRRPSLPGTAKPGWTWHDSGGYCGPFLSHFVTGASSGGPGPDATDSTYTWSFQTRLRSGTCSVSVYIPATDGKTAGGYAVRYTVSSGSGQQASFTLDQKDNRGSWLPGGTYSDSGTFTVVMDTANNGDHEVAASALKATCAGAPGGRTGP